MSLTIGQQAPFFKLSSHQGELLSLEGFKGKTLLIYFYPKDNTPGCTLETKEFNERLSDFKKMGVEIVGVSRDSLVSHKKFAEKLCLDFPLLSDPEDEMCKAYGVLVDKSMFGKKYKGIERSTFLIGPQGDLLHIWRKVKVSGHVEEVLSLIQETI